MLKLAARVVYFGESYTFPSYVTINSDTATMMRMFGKKGDKDQDWIQSSTTPYPGYNMEK